MPRTKISIQPSVMSRILDDPKMVKALIKSFQTETMNTTILQWGPEWIHKNMFAAAIYGTSSSQPYPHQAHILPPRRLRLLVRQDLKSHSNTRVWIWLSLIDLHLPIKDRLPTARRKNYCLIRCRVCQMTRHLTILISLSVQYRGSSWFKSLDASPKW